MIKKIKKILIRLYAFIFHIEPIEIDIFTEHPTFLEYMKKCRTYSDSLWPYSPRGGKASLSEVKRWIEEGAIEVNGQRSSIHGTITYPVTSYIWFPNTKKKTTIV